MPIEFARITLDRSQSIPLPRQLYMQLHQQILHGLIIYKEPLPATRTLATKLNIARGVVVTCYEMLKTDGLVSGFGKGGTQVCYRPLDANYPLKKNKRINLSLSTRGENIANARLYPQGNNPFATKPLTPSVPDFSLFPYSKWQRLSKAALIDSPAWYQRDGGIILLRKNLQTYLSQYRGIHIGNLDRLLITTGTQAALTLLTQLLTNPGDTALIDKPCWSGAEAAVKQADLTIRHATVDSEGTQPPQQKTDAKIRPPKIAIVTPSSQFPTGVPMSMARRDTLIRYTVEQRCWLIEDDYAAEYSYAQHPSPSILAHSNVTHIIHVGTMSKLLFPGLRLGWMLVPEHLTATINNAVQIFSIQPAYAIQQQLGLFMQHGYLSAHLANTRAIYNERRGLCSDYLQQYNQPWFTVTASISGMNHYLKINSELIDVDALKINVNRAGLGCEIYTHDQTNRAENYLLLGHANLQESKVKEELDLLLTAFEKSAAS